MFLKNTVGSKDVKLVRSSKAIDTFFENVSSGMGGGGYRTHLVIMIPRNETRQKFLSRVQKMKVGSAIRKYKGKCYPQSLYETDTKGRVYAATVPYPTRKGLYTNHQAIFGSVEKGTIRLGY
jgi:hypothetical protein